MHKKKANIDVTRTLYVGSFSFNEQYKNIILINHL